MKRYLEYDRLTGRIVSELRVDEARKGRYETAATGLLEIPEALKFDPNSTLVRDGVLARAYETAEERRERERLRREAAERGRRRVKELMSEFVVAMIEADESRVGELRAEYARLRALL